MAPKTDIKGIVLDAKLTRDLLNYLASGVNSTTSRKLLEKKIRKIAQPECTEEEYKLLREAVDITRNLDVPKDAAVMISEFGVAEVQAWVKVPFLDADVTFCHKDELAAQPLCKVCWRPMSTVDRERLSRWFLPHHLTDDARIDNVKDMQHLPVAATLNEPMTAKSILAAFREKIRGEDSRCEALARLLAETDIRFEKVQEFLVDSAQAATFPSPAEDVEAEKPEDDDGE